MNKIFLWVAGTHLSILFLFLVIPWIQGCRTKPKEIITFIEIASPTSPQALIQPIANPTKPKSVPKPVNKTKKPKWKPVNVKPQNRRVHNPNAKTKPKRKKIDRHHLHRTLQRVSENVHSFKAYYNIVKQRVYAVWQQPVGEPVGTTAVAVIRVELNGTISKKSISRHSGNTAFDRAVQAALNAVTSLPSPPVGFPDKEISIEFILAK